ncbi:MAG: molybdopterin converting factor subunit 1 [Proteobacteria bacterium]|nr:molybdopterin converting factor subunit 1 [Pseudomonadota bacterium]
MKILYFARFRQLIGRAGDDLELPPGIGTVADLLEHLVATDQGCAAAFANRAIVRAAVDQSHVKLDHPVAGAREVAFFPPVTGG